MKYIDTHCHINKNFYSDEEIKLEIQKARLAGIEKIIIPATTKEDFQWSLDVANKYENVFVAMGIHPSDAIDEDIFVSDDKLIQNDKIVAIGECGIDLYHQDNPPLAIQEIVFIKQINFALKHDLPVIVHMRNSVSEIYHIIKNPLYKKVTFILHTFSTDAEWTQKFLELKNPNIFFSFSGVITFKNATSTRANCLAIPLNKILTETDSPFLTPHPFRGKKNGPEKVKLVADQIATIRSESVEEVLNALYENAIRAFKLN